MSVDVAGLREFSIVVVPDGSAKRVRFGRPLARRVGLICKLAGCRNVTDRLGVHVLLGSYRAALDVLRCEAQCRVGLINAVLIR